MNRGKSFESNVVAKEFPLTLFSAEKSLDLRLWERTLEPRPRLEASPAGILLTREMLDYNARLAMIVRVFSFNDFLGLRQVDE